MEIERPLPFLMRPIIAAWMNCFLTALTYLAASFGAKVARSAPEPSRPRGSSSYLAHILSVSILVVIVPILLPMAERFGIDLVHFGIMVIANLGIGYVTPPVGTCLYVACSISKEPMDRVIRPLAPLLLVMVGMLAVVAFVPELTLIVPRWLYGK